MDDGLVVAAPLLRDHVDVGDRDDQDERREHGDERDQRQLALGEAPEPVAGLREVLSLVAGAQYRHLTEFPQELRNRREEGDERPYGAGEERVVGRQHDERRSTRESHSEPCIVAPPLKTARWAIA